MVERKAVINNKTGLHARPAALFVQKANRYKSEILIIKDSKEVNAKSIMGIMSLAAGYGSEIIIKAEGEDAQEAVDGLVELVENFVD